MNKAKAGHGSALSVCAFYSNKDSICYSIRKK